ncbi:MAG: hypothetical protein CMD31_00175 [Flavobacteriales bacterium]|nr:hypothetical protein [Flavobacteriales bacterium]|tara:strand:- start:2987 stop:3523 length:537 start_codon:yes stop_codon:yes gene_type:complete
MILPEIRLKELFATLPVVTLGSKSAKVIYGFGTQTDLYKFLNKKRKEVSELGGNIYPILWLETGFKTSGSDKQIEFPCELILATLTTSERTNEQRVDTTFKQQLIPVFDNIKTAFRKSGFTTVKRDSARKSESAFDVTRYYNYGTDDDGSHQTTDIWDAMKIGCGLIMTDQCQREFNY